MKYQSKTEGVFYLFSTMQFDVGMPVRLYGAIQVTTSADLYFVLSKHLPYDPKLAPIEEVTTSIANPLGLKGVVLEQLDVTSHIYKDANQNMTADTSLQASARFPNLPGFNLAGGIVFEKSSPRLAIIQLTANPPLTLSQFITQVIGGTWDWADSVTNQFAFQSGMLYALSAPPDARPNYCYEYINNNQPANKITCYPGYHADAIVRIFGKYDFRISLSVTGNTILLETTSLSSFDFDFITLTNTNLKISTQPNHKYLTIGTDVIILNTSVSGTVNASYDLTQSAFVGNVSVNLGSVDLPTESGTSSKEVTLGVEFMWTKDSGAGSGFRITKISGLPVNSLNWLSKYLEVLNRGGGCAKIVTDWMKGLTQTSLTPKLNGSPSKTSDGKMLVPLKLTYTIMASGHTIASNEISFKPVFDIPNSLKELPIAIWQSILDSAGTIIPQILSQPDTYKAIAEYSALRGGASAAARFICRALENGNENVARSLADEFADLVGGAALAEAAELIAALSSVAMLGIPSLVSGLVGLFKSFWDWITGEDKQKKREAEQKLQEARDKIQSALNIIFNKIDQIQAMIQIQSLNVSLDAQSNYTAAWMLNGSVEDKLGTGAVLLYAFSLLQGTPGTDAAVWPGTSVKVLTNDQMSYQIPLQQIPNLEHYRFNASVVSTVRGLTFLYDSTRQQLVDAIDQLDGIDNGKAKQYASELREQVNQLTAYNTSGIASKPVYAHFNMPTYLQVGQSIIGVNTRLKG
ncbi:hypothetical protein [Paenibacillus xylaniclasticus]|uniref:hypothetical protein n=1 Tax=Paenibacillus xylaniclasticus TaxID=588083 RepID=UPI000FD8A732|nr:MULTISPECIES: hypothetical protein [Paenibacillus]GFN32235.1 hypothetical protein PCURB6_24950 [Paenibacillus curdlanolyticus]